MALRAGYYGVKRKIWENILKIPDHVNDIVNLTGVKNINFTKYTSGTSNGITWTANDDGSVTANGTSTAVSQRGTNFVAPFTAQVKMSGCNSGGSGVHMYPFDVTNNARPYKDSSKSERLASTDNLYNGGDMSFYMEKGVTYAIYLRVSNGVTVNQFKYWPMLRLASDPDNTYELPAYTNQQLTASADDQKTAINAIITAATGAADFAAFKAAMEAITPVTRSAVPEERSLDVEEPVEVKKTTRKSTKKTEEEE